MMNGHGDEIVSIGGGCLVSSKEEKIVFSELVPGLGSVHEFRTIKKAATRWTAAKKVWRSLS